MKKIIILCPFREKFEPICGSTIRIKGYVDSFQKANLGFSLVSPVKPSYLQTQRFIEFRLKKIYSKIFAMHNILYCTKSLGFLAWLLRKFLFLNSAIKDIRETLNNKIVISHQENTIGFFFFLINKIDFIYDIHGILAIQKEYIEGLSLFRKVLFYLGLKHEAFVYKHIKYVNSINKEMDLFLRNEMGFKGLSFFAPDGLLDMGKKYHKNADNKSEIAKDLENSNRQTILFVGDFKKFGGVHFLTETFCKMAKENDKLYLLAIGSGQMVNTVFNLIREHRLDSRFKYIALVPYNELPFYFQQASTIVIPDMNNTYNRLIPHIKLYDALLSGKPVVAPAFNVNNEMLKKLSFHNVLLYKPDNYDDLADKINHSLSRGIINYNNSFEKKQMFYNISYEKHAKKLIQQYKEVWK